MGISSVAVASVSHRYLTGIGASSVSRRYIWGISSVSHQLHIDGFNFTSSNTQGKMPRCLNLAVRFFLAGIIFFYVGSINDRLGSGASPMKPDMSRSTSTWWYEVVGAHA